MGRDEAPCLDCRHDPLAKVIAEQPARVRGGESHPRVDQKSTGGKEGSPPPPPHTSRTADSSGDDPLQRAADQVSQIERGVRRRRRGRAWYRRRRWEWLRRGLYVVYAVLAVASLQLLWAVLQMQQANHQVVAAQVALREGDLDEAEARIAGANRYADRAGAGTFGPHLSLAQHVPLLGDDVRAVREVVAVSRSLTGPLADGLLSLRETLDPEALRPVDGQINMDRLVRARGQIRESGPQLVELDDRLADLETDGLVSPLATRVHDLTDDVHELRSLVDYGGGILEIMPELLGEEGPRSYLVVFQNNAELRSTGGIPTAFAVLDVDDGHLAMRDEGTSPDIGGARGTSDPVLPESAEEQALFGGKLAGWLSNVNLTPHWPRSAELIREFWRTGAGEQVDGVLSVDPVALSQVLRGTGPVSLRDGKTATSDNVVQLLLNQTYLDYPDQPSQNEFFEDTARRIFSSLVAGEGDAGRALEGLYDAMRDGRGYAWLADPSEQERLAGGVVAGELGHSDESPDVGVFLNDSTATKLDFYVSSRTDVTRTNCRLDGGQDLLLTTEITSDVPADAGSFPPLLLGLPVSDTPGELLLTVAAYGPVGSTISGATIDQQTGAPASFTLAEHPVVARTVLLRPGQTIRLTWTVHTAADQGEAPVLRTTPGAWSSGRGAVVESACR